MIYTFFRSSGALFWNFAKYVRSDDFRFRTLNSGLVANFHDPAAGDFDSMTNKVLNIWKGFDSEYFLRV